MIDKAGIVSVVGRPNVGKSTLVNALVGEKLSIVTPKPQTTRHRICGVYQSDTTQVALLDLPGFHTAKDRLDEFMSKIIRDSVSGNDACLMVTDARKDASGEELEFLSHLKPSKYPVILICNKVDTANKAQLLPLIDKYMHAFAFAQVFPLSALTGEGLPELKAFLPTLMPPGPALYPEGSSTDLPDLSLVGELIREKVLLLMREEIPHGVAVITQSIRERPDGLIDIEAILYCERENHKGILVGHGGETIKAIGIASRTELEEIYEGQVNVHLQVKVKKNWKDNPAALRALGFQ